LTGAEWLHLDTPMDTQRARISLPLDALSARENIANGHIEDVEMDISLGVAEQPTHFYLRALQRNGGIIYASPVFVAVL